MANELDTELEDVEVVIKKRKTRLQLKHEQEVEDLRNLLKFPSNRAFLWKVFEYCGIYRRIASLDDTAMRLAAGRHDVALWLKDILSEADPLAFINMQREAQQRENE